MKPNTACAGKCMYEDFKLEYQVVHLEFVRKKFLKLEVVCYNPYNTLDKEAVLKYHTTNLNSSDEKLKVVLSVVDSIIKNLNLEKENLYKLVVRNHEIFYLVKI